MEAVIFCIDGGVQLEILQRHSLDPEPGLLAETQREFSASLEQYITTHGPLSEIPGAVAAAPAGIDRITCHGPVA